MRTCCALIGVLAVACSTAPYPLAPVDAGEPDAGAPRCAARMPGELVITEFLNDPDGVDTGSEWIELFNTTDAGLELEGITVYSLSNSDGGLLRTHVIHDAGVPALGYLTLGDLRMGVPGWSAYYSYGADLGALSNSDGVIGLRCRGAPLLELTYTVRSTAGRARQLDGRIAPGSRATTEADWCNAPTQFMGMNYGSPAAQNPGCP